MRTDTVIIWKEIPGTEGVYFASNDGQVKSVTHLTVTSKGHNRVFPGKVLSQSKQINGYLGCSIQNKVGLSKRVLVHRLIASAFFGLSKLQVNHKNGIKTDNRVENLEYCTASENLKHSFKLGLSCNKADRHPNSILTNNEAMEVFALATAKHKTSEIAKAYGISQSLVSNIKYGRNYSSVTSAN